MAQISILILLCVASLLTGAKSGPELCRGTRCFSGQDRSPCVGVHCQGRTEAAESRQQFHSSAQYRQGQVYPGYQQDAHVSHHQAQSAPLAPYSIIQPQQGRFAQPAGTDVTRRTNPRTVTAEVFHPGCAGGTCATTGSHHPTSDDSTTRECKGIGCKLPLRMRHGTHGGDDGRGHSSPVHVTDRAAQFLDELPDFGSERGAWIQLTCDMKPGQYTHVSDSHIMERYINEYTSRGDLFSESHSFLSLSQGTMSFPQKTLSCCICSCPIARRSWLRPSGASRTRSRICRGSSLSSRRRWSTSREKYWNNRGRCMTKWSK